ncbi:hypothetical protein A6779_00570 [Marinobacter adhaerens]|uniref:Uncharacterized protein n=2 Tax=Marinobacter TaxID=2742 RepID=A0A5M3PM03_9GAMM|nr:MULTISPECIES: hypothetical protein [Marinobacter]ODM32891.1 hypothetical protein A6779_00570 [Marinobacter adhaerens]QTN43131.1 hypothetical protein HZ997_07270 [Marinobacter salsuginis]GBO83786.1 hypothetical protein MS5N3_12370 [Marinobacter salsuginis]
MPKQKDNHRIKRFLSLSALILLTPWLLIGGLVTAETLNEGAMDNGSLQVALIVIIGVVFGALVFRVIPSWKARRSNR